MADEQFIDWQKSEPIYHSLMRSLNTHINPGCGLMHKDFLCAIAWAFVSILRTIESKAGVGDREAIRDGALELLDNLINDDSIKPVDSQ